MRSNSSRFYFSALPINPATITIDDRTLVHRMTRILRLEPGQLVRLFDGRGREIESVVKTITKFQLELEALRTITQPPVTHPSHLAVALTKDARFRWMIEKCVEIGIDILTPILTDRAVKTRLSLDRYHQLIIKAAEQSGRLFLPSLHPVQSFDTFLQQPDQMIVLDPEASESIKIVGEQLATSILIIGPEGGFSQRETRLLLEHQVKSLSLGPMVLRSETAAILGAYLLVRAAHFPQ